MRGAAAYGSIRRNRTQKLPAVVTLIASVSFHVPRTSRVTAFRASPYGSSWMSETDDADPMQSKALAAELAAKGVEMADCTISGTSAMAKVKDTVFMFGGKKEVYDAVVPLFQAMGREWVYMGAHGNGATIKLVVNLVLALNRMALAEGLTLAKKAGLSVSYISIFWKGD